MNTASPTVQIVERLKRANLLDVAERAAKRVELRLVDCIAGPPEVTGGHRALWSALAREGRTAGQIAALVGWPEAAVARELPAPAPPPPDSGPRVIEPKPVARALPSRPMGERTKKTLQREMSKLRVALRLSEARGANLEKRLNCLEKRLRRVEGHGDAETTEGRPFVISHHMDQVRIAAEDHAFPVSYLTGRSHARDVTQARAEAAWRLRYLCDCSLVTIGKILGGRDHTTILRLLRLFKPSRSLLALLPRKEAA